MTKAHQRQESDAPMQCSGVQFVLGADLLGCDTQWRNNDIPVFGRWVIFLLRWDCCRGRVQAMRAHS